MALVKAISSTPFNLGEQKECHGMEPIMEKVAHLMVTRKWEIGTDESTPFN